MITMQGWAVPVSAASPRARTKVLRTIEARSLWSCFLPRGYPWLPSFAPSQGLCAGPATGRSKLTLQPVWSLWHGEGSQELVLHQQDVIATPRHRGNFCGEMGVRMGAGLDCPTHAATHSGLDAGGVPDGDPGPKGRRLAVPGKCPQGGSRRGAVQKREKDNSQQELHPLSSRPTAAELRVESRGLHPCTLSWFCCWVPEGGKGFWIRHKRLQPVIGAAVTHGGQALFSHAGGQCGGCPQSCPEVREQGSSA